MFACYFCRAELHVCVLYDLEQTAWTRICCLQCGLMGRDLGASRLACAHSPRPAAVALAWPPAGPAPAHGFQKLRGAGLSLPRFSAHPPSSQKGLDISKVHPNPIIRTWF